MRRQDRRRFMAAATILSWLCILSPTAPAHAVNELTSIVLHAVDSGFSPCNEYGFDCETVSATIDITNFDQPLIYVLLRNYELVLGLQCAFDWDASWVYTHSLWSCQPNQVNGTVPSGPGETAGTIATAFDAVGGPELTPIGRLHFAGATDGCLTIIESSFPFGTHVIDDQQHTTPVHPQFRGAVCVGHGGIDTCHCCPAVEAVTWGHIRTQYR